MLCELGGWRGVWYLNFNDVRDYVAAKTYLIKIYIGTEIIYFSI